jgi:hypothetical protein
MAQSDGNLNVRTDGLRPSVQAKKIYRQTQTNRKHTENLGGNTSEGIDFHQIYLCNLWQKN